MARRRNWVEKTPVHLATIGQGGGASRRLKNRLAKENWDTAPGFKFRPGFIYTQVRAISARINQNYDGWPADELKKSYHTFIGKPCFVNHENHNPENARGVVVAARFVDANPNDQYIEVIQEIDAKRFPKLAHEIKTGGLDSVSMGAEAAFTICSYCKHKAVDEDDMCDHVMFHKGEKLRKFNRRTGKVDEILVYEKCMKLSFFELSYVFDPADETAVASKVLVANVKQGRSTCPPGAVCEEPDAIVDQQTDFSGGTATGEPASATSTSGGAASGEKPASGGNPDADGILPQSRGLYDAIMKDHPELTIGGYRVDDYHEHDSGALDVMTSDEAVAKSVREKAFSMGAPYVLWQQQQWNADGSVSPMEDRGSPTQNHFDHVHTAPFTPRAASPDIVTSSFEQKVLRVAGYDDPDRTRPVWIDEPPMSRKDAEWLRREDERTRDQYDPRLASATDDYFEWQRKVEEGEIEPERGPQRAMPRRNLQDWSERTRRRTSSFEEAVLKAAGFIKMAPGISPGPGGGEPGEPPPINSGIEYDPGIANADYRAQQQTGTGSFNPNIPGHGTPPQELNESDFNNMSDTELKNKAVGTPPETGYQPPPPTSGGGLFNPDIKLDPSNTSIVPPPIGPVGGGSVIPDTFGVPEDLKNPPMGLGQDPGGIKASFRAAVLKAAGYRVANEEEWDPRNSQFTQRKGTYATYLKAHEFLNERADPNDETLDYGAGHCLSGNSPDDPEIPGLGYDTYEPHPQPNVKPTFTSHNEISHYYGRVVNLNVLNVVPPPIRDQIVDGIGDILAPGGHAVITTRGTSGDVDATKNKIDANNGDPGAIWVNPGTPRKTYQKGFTADELHGYVQDRLGAGYVVEKIKSSEKMGGAGVHVYRPYKGKPAAKIGGIGNWSSGVDGSQIVLPGGHSLRVYAPNRNELIHDRGDPVSPATGSPQFEWIHSEHGMPLHSGYASSEEEARRHAEQSHQDLAHWDPETDVFDPRHGFPSAGEWTAKFERRVLMAAGYKTAGDPWEDDYRGQPTPRNVDVDPDTGLDLRPGFDEQPEWKHRQWMKQNPDAYEDESPHYKEAAGFLKEDEWLDTDGPDDQMFDMLPRGKKNIREEFEEFHNPGEYRHYPDPEREDFSRFEEEHYPKWGLHPDDWATLSGDKPPDWGMPPYDSPSWPPNQRDTVNGRPVRASFERRVLKTAGYKMAWGEVEAPPQVNTLRPEGSMPEDDNDDYHEYVNPADTEFANNNESPQELLTPDLQQAGNIDREQDQQQQGQPQMAPGGPQMAPAGPQQPQQQYMTLQIPIPPQQGQMPMQTFAHRVLAAAGYKLAADGDDDKDDDTNTTPPSDDKTLNQNPASAGGGTDHQHHVGPPPPGGAPPGAPGAAAGVNPGLGGALTERPGGALEDWQLPGGTNPTDKSGPGGEGLAMPFAQSQVGVYSPTLNRAVEGTDVTNEANKGRIDAWNTANPTNVFDPNMKYDPATMQKGVQYNFTMPGPPGAPGTPPPPAGAPPVEPGTPPPPAPGGPPVTGTDLGGPAPPPPPGQVKANRQLAAYFNQYFGTNVENATLENGRGVSGSSRKPKKGSTMGRTNTLAQRGKVASQGRRRQHFAEGPYTDGGPYGDDTSQGDQEEAFVTQVPGSEPVDMPDDDTHNISNTEGNLVARVNRGRQQLLADAKQLAAFQAGKKAGSRRTAESISMERAETVNPGGSTGEAGDALLNQGGFEAVGDSPENTAPGNTATASLQAFQAFDNWLHRATGRQARHLTEVGIKRAANEWSKRAGYDPRVLFPALGIVLRQARKNEAAIRSAAQQKGAGMRRRAVDLEVAAPDGRVDVEAPVQNVTDAEAQESQFDLSDFADNAGDNIAEPDLDTDSQFWAPGEGDKGANKESRRKRPARAGGILAVRAAEAYIRAGLEPNTNERKYQLAGLFENMSRGAVQRDIALLERVAQIQSQTRQKVASGRTRGAGQSIPPGLTRSGTQRSASTRRTSANDPSNDSLLFG